MSLHPTAKWGLVAVICLSIVTTSKAAKPTITAPPGQTLYASDATFDVTVSGTAGAIVVGVFDVGESAFVESHNATIGTMPNFVTIPFNSCRNEWNMDDPPGTPQPTNADIRAAYSATPNDFDSVGININQ